MNILIIAAHPDDEVLGLGGTMIKHTEAGDQVFVFIASDGHSSRNGNVLSPEVLKEMEERKNACLKCGQILGVSKSYFSHFADQMLDTYPLIDIVKEIESFAKQVNPDIVYLHHSGDVNKDHRIMFEAGITAFRPVANKKFRLLAYQTFSSSEWGLPSEKVSFNPNVYVDISDFLERKMTALEQYSMELREYPHPRSSEGIRIAAAYNGAVISVKAAEAFVLLREVL